METLWERAPAAFILDVMDDDVAGSGGVWVECGRFHTLEAAQVYANDKLAVRTVRIRGPKSGDTGFTPEVGFSPDPVEPEPEPEEQPEI